MTRAENDTAYNLLFSKGQFFQIPNFLFRFLSINEVVVLSEIINQARRKKAGTDWFEYAIAWMATRLGMGDDAQLRAVSKLRERGLIETRQGGKSAVRQFRVRTDAVLRLYHEAQQAEEQAEPEPIPSSSKFEELDPNTAKPRNPKKNGTANSRGEPPDGPANSRCDGANRTANSRCYREGEKTSNKTMLQVEPATVCDDVSSTGTAEREDVSAGNPNMGFFQDEQPKGKEPSNFDVTCATELSKAVDRNLKSFSGNNVRKWAEDFRLLRTKDGAGKELISDVLKWYIEQDWKNQYMPQAFSGRAFREKFHDKLVPAMQRSEQVNHPRMGRNDEAAACKPVAVAYVESVVTKADWNERCWANDLADFGGDRAAYDAWLRQWREDNPGLIYEPPGYRP